MNYNVDIYETDDKNLYRFALGISSNKILFVFGLNPSTADNKDPDQTIKKIMGFAEKNGYDSFVMFNLYPQRATNPNELDKFPDKNIIRKNERIILNLVSKQKNPNILLAWGDNIFVRDYLIDCLTKIYQSLPSQVNWWRIGDLTKKGQPRHPSRIAYQNFQKMDMDAYLREVVD